MRSFQFDPFGEPAGPQAKPLAGGSRLAQRAGVSLFWGLVIAIVATRAAYFDQGLEDRLRFVAGLAHSVLSALV